jgi:hypothetical protein
MANGNRYDVFPVTPEKTPTTFAAHPARGGRAKSKSTGDDQDDYDQQD